MSVKPCWQYVIINGLVAFFGLLLFSFPPATAIVLRHDKNDVDALRLGERFTAVGKVSPDGGCTLIARSWVLTAAHVAASIPPGGSVQFGSRSYRIKRTVLHREGIGVNGNHRK